ncbi:hypothetical protein [Mycolicibacterium celeriflavum]|uniref:Uncharacterized protein n=1 Tax=Mycolicibacterium celeriflavum TaxID=1249101 RepID=A0A1X0C2M6_MYCCF|nr:hypothetical protein [Mycolicibacterium celeriflavum]MCV7239548.1 hypothetical protein [Mycolicibacterium celeriflavum]ORA51620.1 hypothetical protein BST21_00610 [Mycolicibacterium celeriflavum]BBY43239.1 hypothetical protein MCEL_15340 [Mycolicibacterium celeriflavum]
MAWAPQYVTADELAAWHSESIDPVENEAELTLAVEAASRAIDKATGRCFGQVASNETRWYTPEFYRDRWLIDIDDLMSDDALVIEVDRDGTPEAAITAYKLTPINAAAIGRPWTRIEVLPSSAVKPNGLRNGVRVSARWGWSAIPSAIRYATLVQAARFYDRRNGIGGTLTSKQVDDVSMAWAASAIQDLDPDVLTTIAGYRRLWAAV